MPFSQTIWPKHGFLVTSMITKKRPDFFQQTHFPRDRKSFQRMTSAFLLQMGTGQGLNLYKQLTRSRILSAIALGHSERLIRGFVSSRGCLDFFQIFVVCLGCWFFVVFFFNLFILFLIFSVSNQNFFMLFLEHNLKTFFLILEAG